jgi:WD repeat-containing protein 35
LLALRKKEVKDRAFHIDDMNTIGNEGGRSLSSTSLEKPPTNDPIVSIAASESTLVVARASGEIHQYTLPTLTLENKFNAPIIPSSIALNSNSSKISLLDRSGQFRIMQLEAKTSSPTRLTPAQVNSSSERIYQPGEICEIERKDVWDVKWAIDNPDMFAIMEKTRLYIFKNLVPEEPVTSSSCQSSYPNY